MKSNLDLYLDEVSRTPLLEPEAERGLLERVAQGDQIARKALISANLRLVISVAKGINKHGMSLEDAIEEGNCGLCKAAGRFDLSHGVKFATYATYWIRAAIGEAIENRNSTIRVPRHAIGLRCKWFRARLQLQTELKREPTTQEIMDSLGIGARQTELIRHADRALGITGLEDEEPEIEQQELDTEELEASMKALPSREQKVLRMRFGFDQEEKGSREIAEEIGTTPAGAWFIADKAMKKLKAVLSA